ncbi:tetratricopeptide repeat protein 22-like [Asterias rubens]|uniref:tetratricopeptide repeat protein 22-like n=1 Tax=Asterias rubens TaxID=7604 RepID=UPI001455A581|nr:tetratricopeptide repeat protein 22-like [Asterias rubens]
MAAADFPDGHFKLPLVINTEGQPLDPITTDYKADTLKRFLDYKTNRPERHAIRNLLGVLAFRGGNRVEEAKSYFRKILNEDPGNLNAKANIDYVDIPAMSAEEYVTSGAGIAASNLGPDVSSETEKKKQGRRYAEQAFAFIYENYHETVTHERYSTAIKLYNMAMDLAGNLVDDKEKDDWHLGIGLASMKILKSRSTKQVGAKENLQITVRNNHAVINSASADSDMKSEAYCRIGLVSAEATRRKIRVGQVPQDLVQFIQDPKRCFEKALELAVDYPSRASIYTRLASFSYRDHDFNGAIDYLNKSIDLDGSKHNFHAYSTRADMLLKQFKYEQKTAERHRRGPPPNRDHLLKAKDDLEFILKEHVSPWDFINLAEVYYLLAKTSTSRASLIEYNEKALETCSKVEACQDGADNPNCHKVKGMCLCVKGEHRQAIESFKRGMDCEQKTDRPCGNAQLLVSEYTHLS